MKGFDFQLITLLTLPLLVCIACNGEQLTPTAVRAITVTPSARHLPSVAPVVIPTVTASLTQALTATSGASSRTPGSITPSPQPTIPPQGSLQANTVAFIVGDWQNGGPDSLWIANIDGSGEMKLLDQVYRFSWAPNGQWLSCLGEDGLWLISLDAKKQVRILANDSEKGKVTRWAWSPDSTRIAFVLENAKEHLGLVEVPSGKITYLMKGKPFMNLSWSPDGRWLAFWEGFVHIVAIDVADGTTIIVNTAAACKGTVHLTAWSPQGDRIAFLSYGNGRYAHGTACLSTLAGYNTWLDVGGHSTNPVWAPQGQGIYVVATNFNLDDPDLEPDPRLLYFDSSGQFVERLAFIEYRGGGEIEALTISPDGQWLAILAIKPPRNNVIQFFSIVDRQILGRTVDVPGEMLYAANPWDLYKWAADSRHIVLMAGGYSTPNGIGSRQYGALYALDFQTGEWKQLTGRHWIKQFATSPVAGK